MKKWIAADIPPQAGRTFLVTGANSGLGFVTSLELARHGATVIMTVRNREKGAAALARIQAEVPDARVSLRYLDMASLAGVKSFARQFLDDGLPLDGLINNAGVMMPPHTLTEDGHELQFGVNHLAHFALTGLLFDRLVASPHARVVTVSSDLHRRGRIRFGNLAGRKGYGRLAFYTQSKLANILFAFELDRRLKAAGLPVFSLVAHPGYADTNLQKSGPTGLLRAFLAIGNRYLAQRVEMGVLPQLYAATASDVEGGAFFGPDGRGEKSGHPTQVDAAPQAGDPVVAAKLWHLSEELTGVRFALPAPLEA